MGSYLFCLTHPDCPSTKINSIVASLGFTKKTIFKQQVIVWSLEATPSHLVENEDYAILLVGNVLFIKSYDKLNNNGQTLNRNMSELLEAEGPKFHKYIDGLFTLLLWDRRQNKITIYSDIFMKHRLCYIKHHPYYFISNDLERLTQIAYKTTGITLNPLYLASYLTVGPKFTWMSPWKEILYMPPGFVMELNYELSVKRYWKPEEDIDYYRVNFARKDIMGFARDALRRSVLNRTGLDGTAILEFSGGLDSTAILAELAHSCREVVPIYYISEDRLGGFSNDYAYVKYAEEYFDKPVTMVDNRDTMIVNPIEVRTFAEPNGYIIQPLLLKRMEETLAAYPSYVLLNGRGGEFCFAAENLLYAASRRYDIFKSLLTLSYLEEKSVWKLGRTYMTISNMGKCLVKREFVDNPGWIEEKTFNEVIALTNTRSKNIYNGIKTWGAKQLIINSMWEWDLDRALPPGRYEYPYLDRELLMSTIACANIDQNGNPGERAKYRTAFKDLLPPKIYERRNKGGTIHTIKKGIKHNMPIIRQLLENSILLDYVDYDCDRVIGEFEKLVDSRTGSTQVISVLICEMWLRSHHK